MYKASAVKKQIHTAEQGLAALCSVASVDLAGCEASWGCKVSETLIGRRGNVDQPACGQAELDRTGL